MKKLITVLFIVLIIAGIGLFAYMRMTRGSAVNTAPATTENQATGAGSPVTTGNMALSPIPTVSQIPLTITSPVNGSTVTNPNLVVKGVTSPKADVFVNDSEVTADAQGSFSVSVTLDEGENTLVVTANDAIGNYSEKNLVVTYSSAQ